MGIIRGTAILLFIIGLPPKTLVAQSPSVLSIIGTWQLESQNLREADTGKIIKKGTSDKSVGILIYDDSGHMAVQIDRRAWLPDFPYTAYYGRYTVDTQNAVVIHHVDTGTVDSYIGTDQRREFEIQNSGKTLIIRVRGLRGPESIKVVRRLVWKRVN